LRPFFLLGGVLGFLGVAFGAFGAHVLASRLSERMLATFETGSRYHLIHVCMLVLVAGLTERRSHWSLSMAGWSFVSGIVLFSGSLYLLAITGIRWFGAITPVGGLAFLLGWVGLAAFAGSIKRSPD
jgi:uncharacterized membrane protein YgdD (TMEM256/DUF423 family)